MNMIRISMPLIRRYKSTTLIVLSYVSVSMLIGIIPCLIAALVRNEDAWYFVIPLLICILIASATVPITRLPEIVRPVNGLIAISLLWILSIAIGSVPFILAGMDPVNAIFESTSGITTTGSTIMSDIESWPFSILLWRSVMQWIGGISIIMIFMIILPLIGFGGKGMFDGATDYSKVTLSLKLRDAGKQFIYIYLGLTIVMIALLLLAGMGLGDTLCVTFSTISTGGFMCRADSLISYGAIVKFIVMIFMFLGGTNFYLHFLAIRRRRSKEYVRNEEFKIMFVLNIIVIAAVYLILFGISDDFDVNNLVNVGLNVVSASTTTGFVSADYDKWLPAAVMLMFFLMIIGGSTGSTSGGIKVGRIIVCVKYLYNGVVSALHPKGVYGVKVSGSNIEDNTLTMSITIALLFFFTIMVGTVIVMLFGIGFQDSITIVVANLTTFGPATGTYGAMGSYDSLNWFLKLFLSLLMWLGRMEILTGLIIMTPGFWKEVMMSRRKALGKRGMDTLNLRR